VGGTAVSYVEHGEGRPVLVLHGAGVDHREAEACFEPLFDGVAGYRRIYPDLPGMGRTPAEIGSAEDVLGTLLGFAENVTDAGHALPHEQPDLLRELIAEWLVRVDRFAGTTVRAAGTGRSHRSRT
jgi:pimeloyl-ACP methyl ester carboxylesterase